MHEHVENLEAGTLITVTSSHFTQVIANMWGATTEQEVENREHYGALLRVIAVQPPFVLTEKICEANGSPPQHKGPIPLDIRQTAFVRVGETYAQALQAQLGKGGKVAPLSKEARAASLLEMVFGEARSHSMGMPDEWIVVVYENGQPVKAHESMDGFNTQEEAEAWIKEHLEGQGLALPLHYVE